MYMTCEVNLLMHVLRVSLSFAFSGDTNGALMGEIQCLIHPSAPSLLRTSLHHHKLFEQTIYMAFFSVGRTVYILEIHVLPHCHQHYSNQSTAVTKSLVTTNLSRLLPLMRSNCSDWPSLLQHNRHLCSPLPLIVTLYLARRATKQLKW